MQGNTCGIYEDNIVAISIGTIALLRQLRSVSCSLEAMIRRLKWYKSWALHTTEHVHVMVAVCGRIKFELQVWVGVGEMDGRPNMPHSVDVSWLAIDCNHHTLDMITGSPPVIPSVQVHGDLVGT